MKGQFITAKGLIDRGGIYDTGNTESLSARIRRINKQLRDDTNGMDKELLKDELLMLEKTKAFMKWIKDNI